jgi:hypothetical protein
MSSSQVDLGMSMLDVVHTDNDVLSLSAVFRQWLRDSSTDTEHLHLSLPAALGDTPLTLKCDLQTRIIDPSSSLPSVGESFVLQTGSNAGRPPSAKVSSAALYPPLPLYKLTAEALVAEDCNTTTRYKV